MDGAPRLLAHNLLKRLELFHRRQDLSSQLQRLERVLRLDGLQFVDALLALGFRDLRETLGPFAGGERFARSGHLDAVFFQVGRFVSDTNPPLFRTLFWVL